MKVKECIARMLTMRPSVLLRNWMLSVWFSYKKKGAKRNADVFYNSKWEEQKGLARVTTATCLFLLFCRDRRICVGSFSNEERQTGQLTNRHRNKSDSSFLFADVLIGPWNQTATWSIQYTHKSKCILYLFLSLHTLHTLCIYNKERKRRDQKHSGRIKWLSVL